MLTRSNRTRSNRTRSSPTWAAALALAFAFSSPPAAAVEGFFLGLDFGSGVFSAPPGVLAPHVGAEPARDFTSPIHGKWTPNVGFRLGWNVLGHVLIEGTLAGTTWSPFERSLAGGGGLAGGRLTWFPAELSKPLGLADLRKRQWDVGLAFGGGYTLLGGPTFGMDGGYLDFGGSLEYYPVRWFSVGLSYRHYEALLGKFYFHFTNNETLPVIGYSAGWDVLSFNVAFHLVPR